MNFPTGTITLFSGTSIPNDWLVCDGSQYNVSAYSDLYDQIGTKFGGTSGENFRVPNFAGRSLVGQKVSASGSGIDGTIGSWFGSTSVTLSSAQSGTPSHNHSVTDPGHSHTPSWSSHQHTVYNKNYSYTVTGSKSFPEVAVKWTSSAGTGDGGNADYQANWDNSSGTVSFASSSLNLSMSNSSTSNASESHANMQPYLVVAFIIKT